LQAERALTKSAGQLHRITIDRPGQRPQYTQAIRDPLTFGAALAKCGGVLENGKPAISDFLVVPESGSLDHPGSAGLLERER